MYAWVFPGLFLFYDDWKIKLFVKKFMVQKIIFYCSGKEAAMVIIVVNMVLSFILFDKKGK